MNINELLGESLFFGMALSLIAYRIGFAVQKKWKKVFLNPMLIAVVLIISFLLCLILLSCLLHYNDFSKKNYFSKIIQKLLTTNFS